MNKFLKLFSSINMKSKLAGAVESMQPEVTCLYPVSSELHVSN